MPYSTRTPHHIWYETAGDTGSPVLLIMGFTMRGSAWRLQIDELSKHHRVAWFDNAGIGASGPVRTRALRMRHMADDALGVIEEAGWDSAHVVGVSMGGMVAQHVALRQPDRIKSLTLTSTHPGGARHLMPPVEGLRHFTQSYRRGREARLEALSRLLFGPKFREAYPERVRELLTADFHRPPPLTTTLAQLGAIAAHNTAERLGELGRHHTLVVRPGCDVLVNPNGSDVLAAGIPNARLAHFEEAGHVVPRERSTEFNELLLSHFAEADQR